MLYAKQVRRNELREQYLALSRTVPPQFEDVFFWTIAMEDVWINDTIREDLERFLAADPGDRLSRLALAAVLLSTDKVDLCEQTLAPLGVGDDDARVLLARLALKRMQIDRVRQLVDQGPPDHPGLELIRGQLAMRSNAPAVAARQFEVALKEDSNNIEALQALSLVYRQLGRPAEAAECRRRADLCRNLRDLAQEVNFPQGRFNLSLHKQLAETCEAIGRPAEALRLVRPGAPPRSLGHGRAAGALPTPAAWGRDSPLWPEGFHDPRMRGSGENRAGDPPAGMTPRFWRDCSLSIASRAGLWFESMSSAALRYW